MTALIKEIRLHNCRVFVLALAVSLLLGTSGCFKIVEPESSPVRDETGKIQTPETVTPKNDNALRIDIRSLKSAAHSDKDLDDWVAMVTLAEICDRVYPKGTARLRLMGFDTVIPCENGNLRAVVCANDDVVVVAFRGTQELKDWYSNLNVQLVGYEGSTEEYIHKGFYTAVQALYENVTDAIGDSMSGKKKTLIVTGHSLGGAMAAVFSILFEDRSKEHVDLLVTFGQPLTFNSRLAKRVNEVFRYRYRRVVNENDIVTRVKKGFYHAGSRIQFDSTIIKRWAPMVLVKSPGDGEIKNSTVRRDDPVLSVTEIHQEESQEALVDDDQLKTMPNNLQSDSLTVGQIGNPSEPARATSSGWGEVIDQHYMNQYIQKLVDLYENSQANSKPVMR